MVWGRRKLPDWTKTRTRVDVAGEHEDERLDLLRTQLDEFFAGTRRQFDLELDLRATEFYRRVWSELRKIPYGETISYRELASRVGSPGAVRAVATANARNPISIIVPCHRVIASTGKLTGYAGGLENKRRLLELEGALEMGIL
jgi:O-6-methylguanine DNA methyltransferase